MSEQAESLKQPGPADHQEREAKARMPVLVQLRTKPRSHSRTDSYDNDSESIHNNEYEDDRMDLEVGENWLRLVLVNRNATTQNESDNDSNGKQQRKQQFILDDTQDTNSFNAKNNRNSATAPYPSIFSGVVPNGGDRDCYLMLDVDDSFGNLDLRNNDSDSDNDDNPHQPTMALTVKDMRSLLSSNESDGEGEKNEQPFEICLARRRRKKDDVATKAKTNASYTPGSPWADDVYGPLETLPRRQLRILKPGDRICTRALNDNNNSNDDTLGLVLEYRLTVPSSSPSSYPYCCKSGFATQDMPEDTQATNFSAHFTAGVNDKANNDDDSVMEEDDNEREATNASAKQKATPKAGPISPTKLEILETSSNEDEKDKQQKHQGGISGTNEVDVDATLTQPEGGLGQTIESEQEEEGIGQDHTKWEQARTTPGSSIAFLSTQPQDDKGNDSDATEFDQNDTEVHAGDDENPFENSAATSTKQEAFSQDNKSSANVEKSMETKEPCEAKTTQETEASSKTSKETTSEKETRESSVEEREKDIAEVIKSSQETTVEDTVPGISEETKLTRDDATNDKDNPLVVEDDDATQDMARELAPEGGDATQDLKVNIDEVDQEDNNATLKQAPGARVSGNMDEAANGNSSHNVGTDNHTKENKENECTPMAAAKSIFTDQLKQEEAVETRHATPSVETPEGEATVGEQGKMASTRSDKVPPSESPLEVAESERRNKQKKAGTPRKTKVGVAKDTVDSVYPDSDNSCNPQKPSSKSELKRGEKNKDEGSDVLVDTGEVEGDAGAVEEKRAVLEGQDDRKKEDLATALRPKPDVSPKRNSSQARKGEGGSILASLVKEEDIESKPIKKPARVKRKKLESFAEIPDELSFDDAVPPVNQTLSDSPDGGSDPTKKRRTKSRKTGNKASPAASASSDLPQAIDTPARSTRKRREAQSGSDSVTLSKRARATSRAEHDSDDDNDTKDRDDEIRVITTGVTLTKAQITILRKSLGGILLEDVMDAANATHVIAGNKKVPMRRTPKLMIGLCCTSNIVSLDWLTESGKAKKALPEDKFLLVNDCVAEKKYDFSMQKSLARAEAMRGNDERLLDGWWVHVLKGVSGNKAPPEKELKLIIEVAGGQWLPVLSKKSLEGVKMARLLIITSDPEVKKQLSTKAVKSALDGGARKGTTSWLFGCIMRQKVDFPTTK